jgi:transcriptional regulator with XRE-family HTH domain
VDFYNKFIELCNQKGVKPSPMLESIGIQKSANSNWKKRKSKPTSANLQKIADYFGVSVEYLKGETENPSVENKGVESKLPQSEDEETIKELYDLTKGLSKNDIALVKAFIAGVRANHEDG